LVFPDGQLPSRRWRPLIWYAAFTLVIFILATALVPGRARERVVSGAAAMTVASRPSVRILVLVPTLVAIGSVFINLLTLEFFGAFLLPVLGVLVFVGVGLLLTLRLPRQPVGWLLLWAGALFQLAMAASAYAWAAFIRAPGTLPLGEVALHIAFAWIPALGCLFLAIMLFPTGRLPSRRWRLPAALVVMAIALSMVASALGQREFEVSQSAAGGPSAAPLVVANPLWIDGTLATLLGHAHSSPLTFVAYLIPLAAALVRFRTAAGTERQQLKWFAYASSFLILVLVTAPLSFPYLAGLGPSVAMVALGFIPISIGIAILRYRLYDIDVLINRTLVYGAVSAALGATYLGAAVLFQALLRPFTSGNELAVAGSTLVVVALFGPLRARIQRFVDRRFYRSRYDAARTLDAFAARLRDQVDLDALEREVLGVVGETLRPAHTALWLRNARR
jgi:hypothetical protein